MMGVLHGTHTQGAFESSLPKAGLFCLRQWFNYGRWCNCRIGTYLFRKVNNQPFIIEQQ